MNSKKLFLMIAIILTNLGLISAQDSPQTEPDNNYAILNIFRPTNEYRSNKFFIFLNSKCVSLIKAKTYQQFKLPAGEIIIMIKSQFWEVYKGEAITGKTYNILLNLSKMPLLHYATATPEIVSSSDQRIAEMLNTQLPVVAKQSEIDDAIKTYTDEAVTMLEKVKNNTAKFHELTVIE